VLASCRRTRYTARDTEPAIRAQHSYSSAVGMTEQDVVTLLGKADRVYRPCWARHARCSYDSAYGIPYRLVGFWLVSFDESGHVIEKEELDSP